MQSKRAPTHALPITLQAACRASALQLAASGMALDEAQSEARLLVEIATGVDRTAQFARPDMVMGEAQRAQLQAVTARRIAHEPMAYLAGRKEFHGRDFAVSPATLIPRPDSEILVETALACLPAQAPARLLDLGTGTGCLLLTLLAERTNAQGVGTDLQPEALELAGRNAKQFGLSGQTRWRQGSWFTALSEPMTFDLILSNPPYISSAEMQALMPDVREYEPESALHGGVDGLDAYRAILSEAAHWLTPGGILLLEIGHRQTAEVTQLGIVAGLAPQGMRRDLAGHPRVVILRKPGTHAFLTISEFPIL